MPIEPKPLFRPEALRPRLDNFQPPPAAVAARPRLARKPQAKATPRPKAVPAAAR